ncbi:MAG: ParA family protein [Salinivenus sp.]
MTVLSVCNHKGGTGKTTTTIHLAASLGLAGWRTLVIDLDPQGFLSRTMGVDDPVPEASVAALFDPEGDLEAVPFRERSGFDLVPSSSTLTKRMRDLNKPTDVLWVREALQRADLEHEIVLFDTAAAVTVYSLNALVACQHVVVPVLPEYQSVVGAEQTFQTVDLVKNKLNPLLESRWFILTQVDGRKRIHRTYQQYLREKYDDAVLDTVIRTSTALAESRDGGTTVFDHDPRARGARDYANAADELVQRIREASDQEVSTSDATPGNVPLPNEVLNS